ncbi:unnamed protein product [Vitrella brassicaformis CCMP3155]|uniref:DUF2256 domain-containing protein n=1 Tax=Vitrella brassicaformis (strain CCMP3155) TaxID=1169540 RepID=A0A0G4EGH0_VITBC|nr:unnamed protein product [Vitrella brassicaformis CCMP3155]|eukprot:CEL95326.1 unnamed protein product [Vitrella brassicaformis CCMP3155]
MELEIYRFQPIPPSLLSFAPLLPQTPRRPGCASAAESRPHDEDASRHADPLQLSLTDGRLSFVPARHVPTPPRQRRTVWISRLQGKKYTKSNLPSKICVVCERPFEWRKKWERCWDEVKYCSERCRRVAKRRGAKAAEDGK